MDWMIPLLGFVVGLLVGMTGIGGAALMTPLLILLAGVRPVVAVGTDLAYGAITKAVGALLHYRRRTVDFAITWHLGVGSIPAALLGVALIDWMKGDAENGAVDEFISRALGLVLIAVALSLLLRPWPKQTSVQAVPSSYSRKQGQLTVVLGAAIGFLVGLTSVGSGSLIAASLVMVYPELALRRVVGTDILHAMLLSAAAGSAHLYAGTVDVNLLGALLLGSIPGVWLGSHMAVRVPDRILRPIMASLLFAIGYKLI
jgi:uncharacterized membrane protein YfcA